MSEQSSIRSPTIVGGAERKCWASVVDVETGKTGGSAKQSHKLIADSSEVGDSQPQLH